MLETFRTGGDCDAWCTRCKMDLAHTIVAMVSGSPVLVKCNTCDGQHKYRPPKSGPKAPAAPRGKVRRRGGSTGAASGSTSGADRPVAVTARWLALCEERAGERPRAYNIREAYAAQEIVDHRKFGLGFVLEELPENRMRVLFRDAERTLITRHGA